MPAMETALVCASLLVSSVALGSVPTYFEKGKNPTMTDEATHLIVKYCFMGTTYVGAYRDAQSAAIVTAARTGHTNSKGLIIPSRPDTFKVERPWTCPRSACPRRKGPGSRTGGWGPHRSSFCEAER